MIGIGALHSKHGYEGLADAAEHLNMTVPLLLLDVRKRDIKDDADMIENWHLKEEQLGKAMEADRKLSGTHFPSILTSRRRFNQVCFHHSERLAWLSAMRKEARVHSRQQQ